LSSKFFLLKKVQLLWLKPFFNSNLIFGQEE